jgi:hypothetical protein
MVSPSAVEKDAPTARTTVDLSDLTVVEKLAVWMAASTVAKTAADWVDQWAGHLGASME